MNKNSLLKIETGGGEILAQKVKMAAGFLERGIGLMFKKNLGEYDGLLLRPCNSIHTCFMQFKIDVVFLNKDFEVVKVFENMKPWRLTSLYLRASQVLELEGDSLKGRLNVGDKLRYQYV